MNLLLTILHQPIWAYVCGIVGGPLLIVALFTAKFRTASEWMRKTSWFAAASAVCWGGTGLLYYFKYWESSSGSRARLYQITEMSAGAALALLILLLTSSEFWKLNRGRV